MNPSQPEAGGSSGGASTTVQHLASFIIDKNLPREKYEKLIEAEGVIHKLVQRLMEKHGGEKHLLVNYVLTDGVDRSICHRKRLRRSKGINNPPTNFCGPSAFLTALPGLSSHFDESGTKSPEQGVMGTWGYLEEPEEVSKQARKRKRQTEKALTESVQYGLEELRTSSFARHTISPPPTWSTRLPIGAEGVLNSLYSPPEGDDLSSQIHKYLIVIAGCASWQQGGSEEEAHPSDTEWQDITLGCQEADIRVSCIIQDYGDNHGDVDQDVQGPRKRLKTLCQETTNGGAGLDNPWFDVPPDTDIYITGLALDPDTVPPSPTVQASTINTTENLVTPTASNAAESPANSQARFQAMQQAAQAIKFWQSQTGGNGGGLGGTNPPLNPLVIQSLLQASKNGGVDPNHPAMQQIKNFIMSQQHAKSQIAMNPAAAAAAAAVNVNNVNNPLANNSVNNNDGSNNAFSEAALLAAMQQQRQQQIQAQAVAQSIAQAHGQNSASNPQINLNQMQNQNQAQIQNQAQNPVQQQQQQSNGPIWSGHITWGNKSSGPGRMAVDLQIITSGDMAGISQLRLPPELNISQLHTNTPQEISSYSKIHNLGMVMFLPNQSLLMPGGTPQEIAANATRVTNFAGALEGNNSVALAPLGPQSDRGVLIFPTAGKGSNGEIKRRLMGMLCFSVPFPPASQAAQQLQQPQQQQQQQQQQQPLQSQNQHTQQQQLQIQQQMQQSRPAAPNMVNTNNMNGGGASVPTLASIPGAVPNLPPNYLQNQQQQQQYMPQSSQQHNNSIPNPNLLGNNVNNTQQPFPPQGNQASQSNNNSGNNSGGGGAGGGIGQMTRENVQKFIAAAQQIGVTFPPDFDANKVTHEQIRDIMVLYKQALERQKQQQKQQQQQQQLQQQQQQQFAMMQRQQQLQQQQQQQGGQGQQGQQGVLNAVNLQALQNMQNFQGMQQQQQQQQQGFQGMQNLQGLQGLQQMMGNNGQFMPQ